MARLANKGGSVGRRGWMVDGGRAGEGQRMDKGKCDAPGFQPELLTLMSRSTVLTWVKRRSTWAIISKTSPTTPNDTPWSTNGQGWVQTLVKPLKHRLTH
jgi:hypothetical protein